MNIILFEDHLTGENRPITLGRAAFDVSLAGTTLYDVTTQLGGGVSAIVREYLRPTTEARHQLAPMPARDVLFLNASLAPSFGVVERLVAEADGGDFLIQNDSRVAVAYFASVPAQLAEQTVESITSFLLDRSYRCVREELPLVTFPFNVIQYHQRYFAENLSRMTAGLHELQPGVFVGEGVKVHPTCVLDAEDGPIVLHDNVSVGPFAYIIGPSVVGRNSKIIDRATIREEVQVGHTCKIGGEIECAIIEPFSNKQHHGFLGHAYVGSWVNMGAGTCNSDLKNTYGTVSIEHGGRRVETGMQFLGCVIGDYSKTAINTSIFTGKIVGVCSCLYGYIGTNVASFTNYARTFGQENEYLLEAAVKTQQRMFGRRKVEQTCEDIKLLEAMHELTRNERLMSTDPISF